MTVNSAEAVEAKVRGRLRAAFAVFAGASLAASLLTGCAPKQQTIALGPPLIAKASCGAEDHAEQLLQGQVPMSARTSGFKGFNCNLQPVGFAHSRRGDGQWQQFVTVRDRAGRLCGYGGPAYWTGSPGTTVVDLTDPAHAHETALITTPGLTMPGEGIRAHTGRGLLLGAYYNNPPSPDNYTHGFDVYDVGADCAHPHLLFSSTDVSFATAGLTAVGPAQDRIYGHEGAVSPDGKTYWVADFPHCMYHAIDVSDPKHPKYIAGFSSPAARNGLACIHGLSISTDGNRVYAVTLAPGGGNTPTIVPEKGEWHDGFMILDASEVQARKPNAQIRMISETDWNDGSIAQMTIPAMINGKPRLVTTSEGGVGLARKLGMKAACAAGRTPFGMARLFDISDEKNPKLVKNIVLEVNNPKSCAMIDPEISAMGTQNFLYDVHMCSVDDRESTTTLACGYFNSGLRVYDIRDPSNVKEIAYYVPPAKTPGSIGWCAAIPILDAAKGMIYSSCADSGVVALKFTHDVWPFRNAATPPDKQL